MYYDNYALQSVLWSQAAGVTTLWDVSGASLANGCGVPSLLANISLPSNTSCPVLSTQHSRDFLRSFATPTGPCGPCVRTAFQNCILQLQVSDSRCGTPYNVWYTESPDWPVASRLGDGQRISAPGRMAIGASVSPQQSTSDACSPLANAGSMSGHWCVFTMSGRQCPMATRVSNCLGSTDGTNRNGIVGVIAVDDTINAPGDVPTATPGTFPWPLPVPVVMISRNEGERLAGQWSLTILTLSKTIGPASAAAGPFPNPGLWTVEHRTGQPFGAQANVKPLAYRFFSEPNRLLGWAFGLLAPDATTTNVGLFDLTNVDQPKLLASWTYAQLRLPFLDYWLGNLVFSQSHLGTPQKQHVWIVGNGTTFAFWNVTDPLAPSFVKLVNAGIPVAGDIFVNRQGTTLWQQVNSSVGWRFQTAWDISNLSSPRLVGSLSLDTSLLTVGPSRSPYMSHPTFDTWGSNLVSFNAYSNGIVFYNYSDPINVTLAAYRDTSPSSCAPPGVGGPSGAIVPSVEPNTWLACQQYEPSALWKCGQGATPLNLKPCEAGAPVARVDIIGYQVLPKVIVSDRCEDGAIVNLFFQRNNATTP